MHSQMLQIIAMSLRCLLFCALVFAMSAPVRAQVQLPISADEQNQHYVYLPLIEKADAPVAHTAVADALRFSFDQGALLDLRGQNAREGMVAAMSEGYRPIAVAPGSRQTAYDPLLWDSMAGSRPAAAAQPTGLVVYLIVLDQSPVLRSLAWPTCQ